MEGYNQDRITNQELPYGLQKPHVHCAYICLDAQLKHNKLSEVTFMYKVENIQSFIDLYILKTMHVYILLHCIVLGSFVCLRVYLAVGAAITTRTQGSHAQANTGMQNMFNVRECGIKLLKGKLKSIF